MRRIKIAEGVHSGFVASYTSVHNKQRLQNIYLVVALRIETSYIRKGRLADIDRQFCDRDNAPNDIRSRVHSGTTNTANVMTIPAALAFHDRISAEDKGAKLRYLRDYWVSRVKGFKGVEILTPDEPGLYGSITSFRLAGKTTKADNQAIANRKFDKYKVFTMPRGGVAAGDRVRVKTSLFTRTSDLDGLVVAIKDVSNSG